MALSQSESTTQDMFLFLLQRVVVSRFKCRSFVFCKVSHHHEIAKVRQNSYSAKFSYVLPAMTMWQKWATIVCD